MGAPFSDEAMMDQALSAAALGKGAVSPNPLVGAVVVAHGQTWTGHHELFGGPHAEVCAVRQVPKELLRGSTLYVTLEPCSHFGKTPPCADLIIECGIQRVVVGAGDPNPVVNGRGIDRLRRAGIEVVTSVREEQCRRLNRGFFSHHERRRPWVILKWAQSIEGYMARRDRRPQWFTGEPARAIVHSWRAHEDAILVGATTALVDNPALTVRAVAGRNPVRVLIDPRGRVPASLTIFDTSARTIVFGSAPGAPAGCEVIPFRAGEPLSALLTALCERSILSVIVEGGPATLQRFIDEDVWDEMRVFTAPVSLDDGVPAPRISGEVQSEERIGEDQLVTTFRAESAAYLTTGGR